MTDTAIRRLHFWYGISLAVLTLAVGILFMAQAADIYYAGEGYSRELVAERCAHIAAPFWIWVAAVAAGGILWMILPPAKHKLKRLPDERADVARIVNLSAKQSENEGFAEAAAAVAREERIRRIVWISCLAACLVCAGIAAYFTFNLNGYPDEPNEAVLGLARSVLPCVAVAFVVCCGAAVFDAVSAKKILPEAKKMLALGGRDNSPAREPGKIAAAINSPYALLGARILLICAAIALIIAGVHNGGMADVLAKAVAICTECIGLG